MLGDLLTHSLATSKIEKFLVQKVKDLLKDISLNVQIEQSFSRISERIKNRLAKIQRTEVNFDLENTDKQDEL